MPLLVTEVPWEENPSEVIISLPLNGVKSAKADIYSNDLYIKVSFPPFLCEIDLLNPVDDSVSIATLGDGMVTFKLRKMVSIIWGTLKFVGPKEILLERRLDAEERHRESQKLQISQRKLLEAESDRGAVRLQMQQDEDTRLARQQAKQAAVDSVVRHGYGDEVVACTEIQLVNREPSPVAQLPFVRDAMTSGAKEKGVRDKHIFDEDLLASKPCSEARSVRSAGKITVKFTPREFRTPLREEHAALEQEWLEKQAEARKATQRAKERDATAIDADPLWLCDRGKEFFKQENYQSAMNAFTEAVTMDPTYAPAYSNRGACHLKMGYPLGCAADCLKAISLLQPACDANAKSRILAYGRRAAALVLLDDWPEAAQNYRQALSIDPNNTALRTCFDDLQARMAKDTPASD